MTTTITPSDLPASTTDALIDPLGPGWYESSRELHAGLEVREGLPANARADEWIADCLRQRRLRPTRAVGVSAPAFTRRLTASPSSITAIA